MRVDISVNDGVLTGTTWYARDIGLTKETLSNGEIWELTSEGTLPSLAPSVINVSPLAGATEGGNLITLNGTNFQFGADVLIGNKLGSSVLVNDPGTTTAFIPTGDLSTINIGIVNPDCQAAFLEDQFEYRNVWIGVSDAGAPEARAGHTAIWTGSEMIVWGGHNGNAITNNDGGRFDPTSNTWQTMSTVGAPQARWAHTAVWTGTEMLVWGGHSGAFDFTTLNTGAKYDPQTDSWTPISGINAPAARMSFPSLWTGTELIVWGGFVLTPDTGSDTGARYNPTTDTWTPMQTTNAPTPRGNHSAVWTGSEVVVWGGKNNNSYTDTGGVYDLASNTWSATTLTNAPAARAGHVAAWTGSEMIVYAGIDSSPTTTFNAGGRYDPVIDSWTTTSTEGAPTFHYFGASHPGVLSANELIMWSWTSGGSPGGARYDPNTDSWSTLWTSMQPSHRTAHTAVWTGSRMIVWGGEFAGVKDTGGIYDPSVDPNKFPEPLPMISTVSPDNGPVAGGTDIVINGSNFRPDISVTIGGDPGVNTTMADTNTIVTTSPDGNPGYADVVVSLPDAPWWKVTAIAAFTYTPFSFEGWIGGGQNGWQIGVAPSGRPGDAEFSAPSGIFVDSGGDLYVADTNNERVQKWDTNGNYIGWIGGGVNGWQTGAAPSAGSENGEFRGPTKIDIDASGNIYITDRDNSRIQKWSTSGDMLGWIGGGVNGWQTGPAAITGNGDGQFNQPMGVVLDSLGNIYIADKENHRIQKWDVNGVYVGWIGGGVDGWQTGAAPASGNGSGSFHFPMDVAVDSSDQIYVADTWNWRVQKWDSFGNFVGWIGGGADGWQTGPAPASDGVEFGEFREVFGVSLDASDNVYAANSGAHSVYKWDASGSPVGWIGNGQYGWQTGSVTGTNGDALGYFEWPWDMAVGPDGKLYIADTYNSRIQKWKE
jgi:N-acetylneuraminic acid mutarotase